MFHRNVNRETCFQGVQSKKHSDLLNCTHEENVHIRTIYRCLVQFTIEIFDADDLHTSCQHEACAKKINLSFTHCLCLCIHWCYAILIEKFTLNFFSIERRVSSNRKYSQRSRNLEKYLDRINFVYKEYKIGIYRYTNFRVVPVVL